MIRYPIIFPIILLLASCASKHGSESLAVVDRDQNCSVSSIRDLYADPERHFGETFCGDAVAVTKWPEIVLVPQENWSLSNDRVQVLLDGGSNDRLRRMRGYKNVVRIRIRGTFNGVRDCFSERAVKNEEFSCTPIRFPTTISASSINIIE